MENQFRGKMTVLCETKYIRSNDELLLSDKIFGSIVLNELSLYLALNSAVAFVTYLL